MAGNKPPAPGSPLAILSAEVAHSSAAGAVGSRTVEDGDKVKIPLVDLLPNKYQPRKAFNPVTIRNLADSIKKSPFGLLQPITAKQLPDGKWMVIGGGQRREAMLLLLSEAAPEERGRFECIDAIVKKGIDEVRLLHAALTENLQREDLNAADIGESYAQFRDMAELSSSAAVAEVLNQPERSVRTLLQLSEQHALIKAAVRGQDLSPFLKAKAADDVSVPADAPRNPDRQLERDAGMEFGKLLRHYIAKKPDSAVERTARHIITAVEEKWSVARVKEFVARERKPRKSASEPKTAPPLFKVEKGQFVISTRLLPTASLEQLETLQAELDRLLAAARVAAQGSADAGEAKP